MASVQVTLPDPNVEKPPRARRWIPISLRIFVAVLVLLSLACAWRIVVGYRQLLTIREIERLGGTCFSMPVGPKWFRNIIGDDVMGMFDEVVHVNLRNTKATADTFHQIGRLSKLEGPNLAYTNADDAALAQLTALSNLTSLDLRGTRLTDSGLRELSQLSKLERLWLTRNDVTDAGLPYLAALNGLQIVWLADTFVTDAGVVDLQRTRAGLEIVRDSN